jgi:hypothetical protein
VLGEAAPLGGAAPLDDMTDLAQYQVAGVPPYWQGAGFGSPGAWLAGWPQLPRSLTWP